MDNELIAQAIQEYKEIVQQEYGTIISEQEATQQAVSILQLFDAISRKEEE